MRKLTTEEWVAKAKTIHNNKYNYSQVDYTNTSQKVTIICPIHGPFEQRAGSHLQGNGCKECATLNQLDKVETFIYKAHLKHNNAYDYDEVSYIDSSQKVTIICKVHGPFKQRAADHLQGCGCRECAGLKPLTTAVFIQRSNKQHKNKYSYLNCVYTNARTKLIITCPEHGDYEQLPGDHLNGVNCPKCSVPGFDVTKPAYLYYLKVTTEDNQILYKIGITNRTVETRFNLTDLQKIEIVKQKLYENGQDALDWEQFLLKKYKKYQYTGHKVLESGNTELFTEDIIELYLSQYRMD